MGFFKKVFKPVRKVLKKIIPKEIRPALPYIAASFGPAGLAGTQFAAMNPAFQKALIAGATAAATDEDANILRTAMLAGAPDALSQGLGNVAGRIDPNLIADSDSFVQVGDMAAKTAGALSRASEGIKGASALKTIGAQTAIDSAAKFAELNQAEIDKYNANLLSAGMKSKSDRRNAIYNIYINTGAYQPDEINSMLDRYGYNEGGIVDALKAENKMLKDLLKKDKDSSGLDSSNLSAAAAGLETAFGRPFGNMEPVPMMRFARGGEVIEETEDLSIMDFMKDQGIEYGQQASNAQNDEILERLFEEFLDLGYSPEDASKKAREAFDEMSRKEGITGTRVASGYKTDIEELYEQHVFEMQEQGLQPMSFAEFVAQARSGMAKGGRARYASGGASYNKGERYSFLINKEKEGILSPDEQNELLMLEITYADESQGQAKGGIIGFANGGIDMDYFELFENANPDFKGKDRNSNEYRFYFDDYWQGLISGGQQRQPQDPHQDQVIEDQEEIFIDKMPRPGSPQATIGVAQGGLMNRNLLNTGMDKDMRGGGFIPEGTKEKADDVPARLSKNEFVMTADAVRAAGGGSINKGAKRMYDTMHQLEAKV